MDELVINIQKRYEEAQSKKKAHINKHRIPKGKYLWLCSLWNEEEPVKSEITLKHYKAVENMWFQQKTKVMLTKKQIKYFNDIYEEYQTKDIR
mgnify:CR=1 FL=1